MNRRNRRRKFMVTGYKLLTSIVKAVLTRLDPPQFEDGWRRVEKATWTAAAF